MLSQNSKQIWAATSLKIFYRKIDDAQGYWMLCYRDYLKVGEGKHFHYWRILQRWNGIPYEEVDLT
jgi:hypothetical protein